MLFEVIQVKQKGVVVRGKSGREYRRHKDDVKRTKLKEEEEVGDLVSTGESEVEEQGREEMRNPMEQEGQEEQYEVPQGVQRERPARNTCPPTRFNDYQM